MVWLNGCIVALLSVWSLQIYNSHRDELVHGLQELEGVHVVDLGSDETLEDTEQTLDLAVLHDELRAAHQQRLPQTRERRDVATLLPQARREQRPKQRLVLGRQVRRGMQLKQLRQDLEDVRDEFCC